MLKLVRPATMPEFFWDSLPSTYQEELVAIDEEATILLPTGSRLFCPDHARADSDWDVFALGLRLSWLECSGWQVPWFRENVPHSVIEGADSLSLRLETDDPKRSLNLILFFCQMKFEQFGQATDLCRDLGGPIDKDERIRIFRKFLDLDEE